MFQMHIEAGYSDQPSNNGRRGSSMVTPATTPQAAKYLAQHRDPPTANRQSARAMAWVIDLSNDQRPLAPRPALTRIKAQAATMPLEPRLIRSRTWIVDSPDPSITRPTLEQPCTPQLGFVQAEAHAQATVNHPPALPMDSGTLQPRQRLARPVLQQPVTSKPLNLRANAQVSPAPAPLAQTLAQMTLKNKPLDAVLRSVIQLIHGISRQHGESSGGKQKNLIDAEVKAQLRDLKTPQTQRVLGLLSANLSKSLRSIGHFAGTQAAIATSWEEAVKLRALSQAGTVLDSLVKALNLKLKIPTGDIRANAGVASNLSTQDRQTLARVLGATATQMS